MKKILACCAFALIHAFFAQEPAAGANAPSLTGRAGFTQAELRAWPFLHYRMLDDAGIIRYLVTPKKPSPDAVFESMGQAMEYLALVGDGALFARYAERTERFFRAKEGYYCWQIAPKDKKRSRSTALVDDLRLFRAYSAAHAKKLGDYTAKLRALAGDIYRFDTDGGMPVSFYNAEDGSRDTGVLLFYLDVGTMERMARHDGRWKAAAQEARKLLLAIPENAFGFYPPKYDYKSGAFEASPRTNMVENLYTGLFLRNVGGDTKSFAAFLKKEISAGRVYNLYDTKTGRPVAEQGESVAVYALAARFLSLCGEHAAAVACHNKVLSAQIGVNSDFMGGFSLNGEQPVYAFDQLEALLMLRLFDPSGSAGRETRKENPGFAGSAN